MQKKTCASKHFESKFEIHDANVIWSLSYIEKEPLQMTFLMGNKKFILRFFFLE